MKKSLVKMHRVKKILFLVLINLFLTACTSVKKQNEHLETLLSVDQMKHDVDYTYKKLQQLHPNLYGYIDKSTLDYKFDSLKTTLTSPLKPLGFYKKLSPLVAAVRQGHSLIYAPTKQFTKTETKALSKKGAGPISQFDLDLVNDKLYVIKNKSQNKSIQPGSEIVTIDAIKPSDLIAEHEQYFSSDGYNTTYKKVVANRKFAAYFTTEKGIQDSIQYQFKYKDTTKSVTIRRKEADKPKKDSLKLKTQTVHKIITQVQKDSLKAIKRKKRINGYNKVGQNYNRNFDFIIKDSSVALMKIRAFSNKGYKTFYKESFKKLKDQQTKILILDLRYNGGGRLSEIVELYSYVADSSFVFLDKSEVVSRASLLRGAYFESNSLPEKIVKVLFAPVAYAYGLIAVRKDTNGNYYTQSYTKPEKVKPTHFSGKMYVLINGGSFSASSIISSNLKGSKRATFVGQETGGAYNGTVAGFMPEIKLPNSQLKVRIGILNIVPHYKTPLQGHGIYPDYEIIPNLSDKIEAKDPELEWIIQDIKSTMLLRHTKME